MRTARLLPVSPSMHCWGGGYLVLGGTWSGGVYLVQWGVPGPGGCTWSQGVYLVPGGVPGPRGCTWSQGVYLVWGVYLVSGGCTWSWGVYLVLGGCVPGPRGVYLVWGVYLPRYFPPVNRMTNRCKNITLPQTSFAGCKEPGLGMKWTCRTIQVVV